MTQLGPASLRILELVKRPQGCTSAELIDPMDKDKLRKLKLMGRAVAIVRWRQSRYFETQESADAWVRENPETGVSVSRVWSLNLPGTPKNLRPFEPKHVGEAKRTQCPNWTHDPRFQLAPGEKPPALFSALPIGVYLEA
jgi:hypothetical protein